MNFFKKNIGFIVLLAVFIIAYLLPNDNVSESFKYSRHGQFMSADNDYIRIGFLLLIIGLAIYKRIKKQPPKRSFFY